MKTVTKCGLATMLSVIWMYSAGTPTGWLQKICCVFWILGTWMFILGK